MAIAFAGLLALSSITSLPLQDAQIKKMTGNNTYGFVHFLDLMSAVIAKRRMDGSMMRASRLKVGGVG